MKGSGHLAQETWVDLRMIIGEPHHQKTHQNDDIPGDDDDDQPTGDKFNNGERDEGSRQKKLVSNGIEVSPQFGPLVSNAGKETVNPICNPCNRKGEKSPFEIFIDDAYDEDGN